MCRAIGRLAGGWPLKPAPRSPRARRRGAWAVEVAGLPLGRQEAPFRGLERLLHLDGSAQVEGAEGQESLRQGPQEPSRQEPDPHRLDEPARRDGRVHVRRGGYRRRRVFEAYVQEVLAPSLLEGQVVVLDGLGAHRTARVRGRSSKVGGATFCSFPPTRRT